MKLRWVFLLGVALASVLTGLILGLVLTSGALEPWVISVTMFALVAVIVTPVVAFVTVASTSFDIDAGTGRVAMQRMIAGFTVCQLVGVVALVLVAVAEPALAGFVIVSVVVSAVLLFGGLSAARRIRQQPKLAAVRSGADWSPWSPAVRRQKIRNVVLAFVIGSAASAVLAAFLVIAADDDGSLGSSVFFLPVGFGFGSASVACAVVSWPLVGALKESLGNDFDQAKSIGRVVLQGKHDVLSADGRRRAATYAVVLALYLPYQIAQVVLLFTGLWSLQAWRFADITSGGFEGRFDGLTVAVVIGYPVLLAVVLPFIIGRALRARRYSEQHASERSPVIMDGAGDVEDA